MTAPWPEVPLTQVADLVRGVSYPKTDSRDDAAPGYVPVLRATNIQDARLVLESDLVYVAESNVSPEQRLRPGDIVVATSSGSKHLVGKSAHLHGHWIGSFGAFCAGIRPKPNIESRYLAYFLQSPRYWKEIGKKALGVNINNLRRGDLETLSLPLPPAESQREIVAEIEKQFSRLDEAVANLQRVKANLRRFESSTLKAALSGCLVPTEAELALAKCGEFEPADELLKRIGRARTERTAKGRGADGELTSGAVDLPALPSGWSWATLSSITSIKGGITVDSKRTDSTSRPVPYLRVANVQRGYLDLAEMKLIQAPAADIDALRLKPGDILFNEGGDRDKLGRGWIWEGQLAECIHQNHVFRARPLSAEISSKLISWWGNTFGKDYFQREGKQTTNLASINLSKLSKFPVPIPPLAEQRRIVAEVDRRLSILREVEAELDANLKRAERLSQSTLARAFGGVDPPPASL